MDLDVIELQVKDFRKALDFYRGIFNPAHVEGNFAMFKPGKATLALFKGKKKGINVSKIANVHWGRKFSFSDPEGNTHFVYEEKRYKQIIVSDKTI